MISQVVARHIDLWPIDKLIPYAKNPRTHSDAQVAQIALSITEFGFNNPILVDTNAGIIAGHGRLLAARKLQLTEVPVIVLDHLTEKQKRAYIIADNQLALNAGWDEELLRLELAALQEEGFNLYLIGVEDDELARLLSAQDAAEGLTPGRDGRSRRVGLRWCRARPCWSCSCPAHLPGEDTGLTSAPCRVHRRSRPHGGVPAPGARPRCHRPAHFRLPARRRS